MKPLRDSIPTLLILLWLSLQSFLIVTAACAAYILHHGMAHRPLAPTPVFMLVPGVFAGVATFLLGRRWIRHYMRS